MRPRAAEDQTMRRTVRVNLPRTLPKNGAEGRRRASDGKPETVLTFMAVGGSNEQAFDVVTAAADLFNAGNAL